MTNFSLTAIFCKMAGFGVVPALSGNPGISWRRRATLDTSFRWYDSLINLSGGELLLFLILVMKLDIGYNTTDESHIHKG